MVTYYDAFISYGRADSKAFAIKLNQRLEEENFKVWFDQNDIPPAVDWQQQINDGIEKTNNFLFIISPHSVKSKYCRKEIEWAVKFNKRILPLLYINSDAEYELMHPVIKKRNWLLWLEKEDDFNFEKSFQELLVSLKKDGDYVKQHTKYLIWALKWQRNQQQTQYLLVGEDRVKAESWLQVKFTDGKQAPCIPTDLHCQYICESTKNANNLLTEVFICHNDSNSDERDNFVRILNRHGITCWTNKTDIQSGREFQQEINKGIEGADNFVYLFSRNSVKCIYCQQELAHALKYNKRIIPILIEPIDLETIPQSIKGVQFLDFTETESVDELIKLIKEDANYYQKHKVLLVKALKWKSQNKNSSLLLRGYNLQNFDAWLNTFANRKLNPPLSLQIEFIRASFGQTTEQVLDIFISYSSADSDIARKLNDRLQELGKTTWFDQESIAIGEDFKKEIEKGIESCDNFVFIISPNSINSPYCADEVEYAFMLNKRFVTILWEKVEVKKLHPALARVQWIDFRLDDFHLHFNELIRIIDTDRDHVRNHNKWSQKALEWKETGKNNDFLLRGVEFDLACDWLTITETERKQPPPNSLQKEFIEKSRIAIAKIAESKKQELLILRALLVGITMTCLLALGLSVSAWKNYQEAKASERKAQLSQADSQARYSYSLFVSHQQIEGLIEAIRAGKITQEQNVTNMIVLKALNQAVYGIREKNRLMGHKDVVNTVAFSPVADILATAGDDTTIKLWDLQGNELKTISGHNRKINTVVFSADGQIIASGGTDNKIKLWDLQGNLLKTLTGHTQPINSVAFSKVARTLATSSDDKTIKLWDLQGNLLKTIAGHTKAVNAVTFSPNGRILASGSDDKTIKLWDLRGNLLRTITGHGKAVNSVSFSVDNQMLATASDDKTIKLWDLRGNLIQTITGHDRSVNNITFSSNNQMIASASDDETVKLWDLQGNLLQTFAGYQNRIWDVNFSNDDKTIAIASWDKPVKIWDIHGQRVKRFPGHAEYVWELALSPNGKMIATGSRNHKVQLWDFNGKFLKSFTGHDRPILSVAFSNDNQTIVSASMDGKVKLWDINGKELKTLSGHQNWVHSAEFSPDDQLIVTGGRDKTVKLWNRQGELLSTFAQQTGVVTDVTFNSDGQIIASAHDDGILNLWNQKGEIIKSWSPHNHVVRRVVFSPDGQTIATASYDKTVKLWDLQGNHLNTLSGHQDEIGSLVFSNDGNFLASASKDKTVILWSKEGKIVNVLSSFQDTVWTVAFSGDDRSLITSSGDNLIQIWDLEDLDLDSLIKTGCNWLKDYLENSKDDKTSDRDLCVDNNKLS